MEESRKLARDGRGQSDFPFCRRLCFGYEFTLTVWSAGLWWYGSGVEWDIDLLEQLEEEYSSRRGW
jgi:hypothetical protein